MTPQERSQEAARMWEEQKEHFDFPLEQRMAFILGACMGLEQAESRPECMYIHSGEALLATATVAKDQNPLQSLEAFIAGPNP